MAKCKFCMKEIVWMKEGRKNIPVEQDGTLHRCEEMQKSRRSLKSISISTLNPDEIAKYEKGINKGSKK